MPRKSLDGLTESMFYVLMAFEAGELCGTDIVSEIERRSAGRLRMGPATLYTLLGKFEKEKLIEEVKVEGRKRTYRISSKGRAVYFEEKQRLRACLSDAEGGQL